MAATVDFSGVFDSTLPNVYIKKAILSPSAEMGSRRAVRHDDEERNYRLTRNRYGKKEAKKQKTRFGDRSKETMGLSIEIELVIKDAFIVNNKPTWFEDEELLDLLKLRVVLSKKQDITDSLLNGRLTRGFLRREEINSKVSEQIFSLKKMASESMIDFKKEKIAGQTVYSINYTAQFDVRNYTPKHLAVFAHTFINFNEAARRKGIHAESTRQFLQGNSVAEILVEDGEILESSSAFLLPNKRVWAGPVHLHKDAGYMAGAFHSAARHPTLEKKRVPNLVVQDMRLIKTAKEASLLLRPFRKEKPGKTRGVKEKGKDRKGITNIESIKAIRKDAYITEPEYSTDANNRASFIFHIDFEKIVKEHSEYTAFLPNADEKTKKQIYSNSRIKSMKVFRHRVQRGLQRGEIVDVEYEDRTQLIGYSTERVSGVLPRRVVKGPSIGDNEDSKKVVIGAIKELYLNLRDVGGIRSFGVTDYDMERRTDGLYSYSVEIEMEDYTYEFVKKQIAKLTETKRELEKFYQKASRRGNSNSRTDSLKTEFIDGEATLYPVPSEETLFGGPRNRRAAAVRSGVGTSPWLAAISVYADILFNLTELDVRTTIKISSTLQKLCDPIIGSLSGIEIVVSLLNELLNKIKNITGNLDRMITEVNFTENTAAYESKLPKNTFRIRKKFKKVHDSNVPKNIGYDFLSGRRPRSIGPRQLTVEEFKVRMDLEHGKYFAGPVMEETKRGTSADELSRNAKDFTKTLRLIDQYYSFITPSVVKFGARNNLRLTNTGKTLWNPRRYNGFTNNILAHNPRAAMPEKTLSSNVDPLAPEFDIKAPTNLAGGFDSTNSAISSESLQSNVASSILLGGLGTSISSPEEYQTIIENQRIFENDDEDNFSSADPKDLLGEDTKFATDAIALEDQALQEVTTTSIEREAELEQFANVFVRPLQDAQGGRFDKEKDKGISKLSPKNSDNLIDTHFASQPNGEAKKQRYLSGLPNQVKSIFLGDKANANVNWFAAATNGQDLLASPDLANILYYNYKHVNRIEVLVGFEKDKKGNIQIAKPVYKLMTKDMFDRIKESKRLALCRMRPHSDSFLNFSKSSKLKMPEFDASFVIGPRQTRQRHEEGEAVEEEDIIVDESQADISRRARDRDEISARRSSDFRDLNDMGTRVLIELVKKTSRQDGIPVEFTSTAAVQQPTTVTRVGTRFAAESEARKPIEPSQMERSLLERQPRTTRRTRDRRATTSGQTRRGTRTTGRGGQY